MSKGAGVAGQYFGSLRSALGGIETYLEQADSPLYKHDVIGGVVVPYLRQMLNSLDSWEHRSQLEGHFKIAQSESGFPAYKQVLDLEIDQDEADKRLKDIPARKALCEQMIDVILRDKEYPEKQQSQLAERDYLQAVLKGDHFKPFGLPETVRVSTNPKTKRPYYVVHWGYYDGSANLPMIYMATVEDSSEEMLKILVDKDGNMRRKVDIPLPVAGLLNPELAEKFDRFCEAGSSYSLTLSTIGTNMDEEFFHLHPKQLRRIVLGPFYHSGFTRHGNVVDKVLSNVKKAEDAWMMTWTVQEIYSMNEKPVKYGLWSKTPAREEFYINTSDLDCARMGVSAVHRHALVPYEAYQAIYAAGKVEEIFDGYQKHIINGKQVMTDL